jgi:Zn-dependent peptidase ImmA (M78 family)
MSEAVNINQDALAAWLRRGEIVARKIECRPYDKAEFRDALSKIREYTVTEPEVFQPAIQRLCAESGVALVFLKALPNTGISGVTRWLTSDKALIQLSLRYKTNDHLWFSFFHEAAHILKHNKGNVYLEEKTGAVDSARTDEVAANNFAANLLIPPPAYRRFTCIISRDNILAFAREISVHPGIVVGRLQHDRKIRFDQYNDLKERLVLVGRQ